MRVGFGRRPEGAAHFWASVSCPSLDGDQVEVLGLLGKDSGQEMDRLRYLAASAGGEAGVGGCVGQVRLLSASPSVIL